MQRFDLAVIGGGPGGYTAAEEAARLGLKTALIEAREPGGVCLYRGCIPTKAMLHTAELLRSFRQGGAFGIHAEQLRFDYGEMLAYRRETVKRLGEGITGRLRAAGVTVLKGQGQAMSGGRIRVTAQGGESVIEAEHVLLATGSRAKKLPVQGVGALGVLDSDGVFELEELPKSLLILGGGVIGVEMAEALSAMGTQVTLLEAQSRLLPEMDREISQNLRMIFKKRGIELRMGATLQNVERDTDGLSCSLSENGVVTSVHAQYVLCAVGRVPNSEGLFADDLRPELTPSGHIKVNESFQTSLQGVYAVGDLIPGPQLAHAAIAGGKAVARLLAGKSLFPARLVIPRCVYTSPEIAEVGLTEKEADERGIPVRIGKALMGGNGRTLIAKGQRGFVKVVADAKTEELLGAQLMCERATDIIGEFALAIANKMTVRELLHAVRPHPTFEETVGEAAEELLRDRDISGT